MIKKYKATKWVVFLLGLFLLLPAWSEEKADLSQKVPSFWKVEGKQNTLWLFGSIHVLTKAHYPLAEKVEKAFGTSPNLVVEVDVMNIDPLAMQRIIATMGTLPEGTSLRDILGEEQYVRANELAAASGYNLEQMNTLRPWLITMMLAMAELAKVGLTPDQGVENYFLGRAGALNKSVVELETVESQLSIFTEMDRKTEAAALMQTLEQLQNMEAEIKSLIQAWENGSLGDLEESLLEEFADYPGLYKRLVTDRNHNWIKELTRMLKTSEKDYFVVVGALHMVGEEGVVNLLRKQGYKVTKQ